MAERAGSHPAQTQTDEAPGQGEGERHATALLWRLSGAFFLTFLGAGAFQQFITPYLRAVYHLSPQISSAALATVYLVAFACLIFTTYSMAWLGEYAALVLATLAYGLFAAVALVTGNVAALVLAAAVWGWGASVLWTAGAAFTLDLAGPGAYGRAAGRLYSGVFVGQALGVALLGAVSGALGPRGMAACAVGIALLGAGAAAALPRKRQQRAAPRLLNPIAVLSTPTTRLAALVVLLSSSGFGLLLGIFGQVVASLYGVAAVGWITAGFYVARIPAGSGGGWLIDRYGRRPVLCGAFLCAVVALLLAAWLHHPAVFALCACALGVQAAVVPVGLMSWVGDRASAEHRPSTYAAVQVWSNMGTGLAILGGTQLLAALGGWQGGFLLFALIYLICTALATRLI